MTKKEMLQSYCLLLTMKSELYAKDPEECLKKAIPWVAGLEALLTRMDEPVKAPEPPKPVTASQSKLPNQTSGKATSRKHTESRTRS